jgi:L-cystine uptake protein TcyP (sodium:dicarboxylate symporter family)
MSDALDAEAAMGRNAVAAIMADPFTVTLKKSLLVFIIIFIGISSLSSLGSAGVPIVRLTTIGSGILRTTAHLNGCPSKS